MPQTDIKIFIDDTQREIADIISKAMALRDERLCPVIDALRGVMIAAADAQFKHRPDLTLVEFTDDELYEHENDRTYIRDRKQEMRQKILQGIA